MQTRIKIAFQAMDGMPEIRGAIEEHVGKLEQRHGPLRGCGVTVKGPGKHRAGLYEVKIHIALTQGLEVDVGPPPQQDERYADLTFAVNDTFRRARRRLQDHIRRMHEQRKKAERQPRVRAAEGEPREIAGSGIPRAGSTVAEPAATDAPPPINTLRSLEPASEMTSAETGDSEPATPAPAETAGAEPLVAETRSAEPAPADVVDAQPLVAESQSTDQTPADPIDAEPATPLPAEAAGVEPLIAETRSAEPTPADVVDAQPLLAETENAEPTSAATIETEPLLPETASAEPATADVVEAERERATTVVPDTVDAELGQRATTASAEPVPAELETSTSLPVADAETTETGRRDLPALAPAATIDPLAFVNAMGSFVRAATALNTASTNLMNSCLTYSAVIFNSMMKVRPSPIDKGVKPQDATKT